MKKKRIRRGDIYYADLEPAIGCEQGGFRPVLIISNDKGNEFSQTVIVAPITSRNERYHLPTHRRIYAHCGLKWDSMVLFEQMRAIDKHRLQRYLGTADRRFMQCAERAMRIALGI